MSANQPQFSRRLTRRRFLVACSLAGASASLLAACGGSAPSASAPAASNTAPSATAASVAPTTAAVSAPTTQAAAQPTATTATSAAPTAQAAPQKATTLTLFAANGLSKQEINYWNGAIIKPYEAANPNIHINFVNASAQKLLVDLAGNNPPDVIDIETKNLPSFAIRGAVPDITSLINTSKVKQSDYSAPDIKKVIFNGKWYGIPWDTAPAVIYYNKKLFDKAGVKYLPTSWKDPSWTWQSFLATAHKLTSGTGPAEVFGWGPTNWWVYWMPWVWENGGDFTDSTGKTITVASAAFQEAFTFYSNLILKEHVAPSPTQSTIGVAQMFYTNKIAMMSSGSYFSVNLDKSMGNTDWDIAPYPKGKTIATRSPADCHTIAKASPNQDEAWKMILWLTGTPGQKAYALGGYTPVLKSVVSSNAFLQPSGHVARKVFSNALLDNLTHHTPVPAVYPQVNNLFTTPINNLLRGTTTVDALLKTLQPQFQKLLDGLPPEWRGIS